MAHYLNWGFGINQKIPWSRTEKVCFWPRFGYFSSIKVHFGYFLYYARFLLKSHSNLLFGFFMLFYTQVSVRDHGTYDITFWSQISVSGGCRRPKSILNRTMIVLVTIIIDKLILKMQWWIFFLFFNWISDS